MTWLAYIKLWLNRPRAEAAAAACYASIVAQARQPAFYQGLGVPDTPQGRFELLMLHAALIVGRLSALPAYTQNLFDLMFADFDINLRELGVGDLGVGKRVHSWAQAFHGRSKIYWQAIDNRAALAAALGRNIGLAAQNGERLAQYTQTAALALETQTDEAIMNGQVAWPNIEGITK